MLKSPPCSLTTSGNTIYSFCDSIQGPGLWLARILLLIHFSRAECSLLCTPSLETSRPLVSKWWFLMGVERWALAPFTTKRNDHFKPNSPPRISLLCDSCASKNIIFLRICHLTEMVVHCAHERSSDFDSHGMSIKRCIRVSANHRISSMLSLN